MSIFLMRMRPDAVQQQSRLERSGWACLAGHSLDLLCIAELRGHFTEVSVAWTRCLGWSREELLARPWLEFVHHADRRHVQQAMAQFEQAGELRLLEARWVCKDGSCRWLSWNASLLREQGLLVSVARDITERRQAERQLRMVQSSIQRSPVPTFWIGVDGRPRFVNQAASNSLGYTPAELTSMRVWDFDPTFTPERWQEYRSNAAENTHAVLESLHRRKDGTVFPVEVSVHYIEFEGERLSVSFVRDISQRKRDEEERARSLAREQAARAQAQEANRAKDRFLAVLSHELRNPLAAILASIDLLRRRIGSMDTEAERAMDVALRNARLEARLIDDLLDFSHVVRGDVTLRLVAQSLEQVARLAVASQEREAATSGIELSVVTQPDLWVDADPVRMQQVMANLLSNALHYTPAGGRVCVRIEGSHGRGRMVVQDSGIGIETARLRTVFDTVSQHGEPGTRSRAGLGIGLALVKSLVEAHGGRVWAESEGVGHGSRFTVELPLIAAPEVTAPRDVAPDVQGEQPITVLLIEDNPDTRDVMAESLSMLGYRVTAAASAEEALAALPRSGADVILADIGLPGMNGYEFLREAHRRMPALTAPAFALTGFGQSSDVERSRQAGFVEHLVKPVDLDFLDARLRAWTRRAGAATSASR